MSTAVLPEARSSGEKSSHRMGKLQYLQELADRCGGRLPYRVDSISVRLIDILIKGFENECAGSNGQASVTDLDRARKMLNQKLIADIVDMIDELPPGQDITIGQLTREQLETLYVELLARCREHPNLNYN